MNQNILAVYGTGIGADAADGNVASLVSARIAGQPAPVLYAGSSVYLGLNQINILLPAGLASGTHDLEVIRSGIMSNKVTIAQIYIANRSDNANI